MGALEILFIIIIYELCTPCVTLRTPWNTVSFIRMPHRLALFTALHRGYHRFCGGFVFVFHYSGGGVTSKATQNSNSELSDIFGPFSFFSFFFFLSFFLLQSNYNFWCITLVVQHANRKFKKRGHFAFAFKRRTCLVLLTVRAFDLSVSRQQSEQTRHKS